MGEVASRASRTGRAGSTCARAEALRYAKVRATSVALGGAALHATRGLWRREAWYLLR